ncbi:MAG: ABC transporter permease subunit [Candidatus Marinimicrobia bacterium]|nr:ABC transporter permease subunit [Candidatus Neomarinimicrobiota bacterium]
MRNVKILFLKELKSYFNSPMAYIFLVLFVIFGGYFFTNTFFLINQSDLRSLFSVIPLIYLFFIPAITMSLIAKESNSGTMEIISTLPIKDVEFVLGKFLAATTLVIIGLGFTLVHFFTLLAVGTNIDFGAILCGYIGLILVGGFYASIGTFTSSLTDNQVVAFIIAITIVIVFFLLDKLLVFMPTGMSGLIQFISVDYHLSNISRGVIDSRNLVYFGTMITIFLLTTVRILEMRKWR